LENLHHGGTSAGMDDAQLLERIASGRDEVSRMAFEVIVARHGRMVLWVCRQALKNPHDAQDAFQATFLVLAERAGLIRCGDCLASWLFGVARRVCARARLAANRRYVHERKSAEQTASSGPSNSDVDHAVIHEEIARLPERYRLPVILCYLEGLTYEVAADRLGCPLGTLSIRLSRARGRLRSRLLRRGLSASVSLPAVASPASPGVPSGLALEATRLALRFMSHREVGGGTVPSNVVNLAQGVLKAMQTTTTMKTLMLGFGVIVVAGLGGLAWSKAGEGPRAEDPPKVAGKNSPPLAGDLAKLQGFWIKIDPGRGNKELASMTWEISGTTLINRTKQGDGREGEHRSEIRVDEQITPHGIDLVQNTTPTSRQGVKGKEREMVERCIYKIEGELLTICGRPGFNQPRPTEFPGAEGGDSLEVSVYRRGKPAASVASSKTTAVVLGGDLARLQGVWVAERLGPGRDMTATVKVEVDVMTFSMTTPSSDSRRIATVTLDEKARPRSFDLASDGPKPVRVRGIYQLDGDSLTLRLGSPDGPRPTELKAEGPDPFSLLILKRRPIP